MASSVLEQFLYVFQPKDNGVGSKLDEISAKAKKTKEAAAGVSESFSDFSKEARTSLEQLVPGSDKMVENLRRIGEAFKRARQAAAGPHAGIPKPGAAGSGGGSVAPPPLPGAGPPLPGEAADSVDALGVAAGAVTVALGVAAVAVGVLTKAFIDGAAELSESRKAAQTSGINSIQQAAGEQYAKSLRLNKTEFNSAIDKIAQYTKEGYIHAHEFGNIFGLTNPQTAMLRSRGIRTTDGHGNLRNASVIFDDITKKIQHMSRESGIAFGQFAGMSKDMATAIRDSGMTFEQYARQHQQEVQAQAKAIDQARNYEKAQQDLSNAWDNAKIKIGGALLPVVTELVDEAANLADESDHLGSIFRGLWETIKEGTGYVTDLASALRDKLFGKSNSPLLSGESSANAISGGAFGFIRMTLMGLRQKGEAAQADDKIAVAAQTIKDETGRAATREQALARIRQDEEKARADYLKKFNAPVSEQSKAADLQWQAANMMKVATDRFGLSTEQYFAMWAAKAGEEGGLRHSGGVTPEAYQDIYRSARAQYAPNAEWATALYGRGAPFMSQLPAQYVQGMKINPFAGPSHPIGLSEAKGAVQNSNFAVPRPGDGASLAKPTSINVTTGPITIQTKSSDPNEINSALGMHLAEQTKYFLNKLNDGQLA